MEEWNPFSCYRVLRSVDAAYHCRTAIRDHDCRCCTLGDDRRYSVDQVGKVSCVVLELELHDNRAFGCYLGSCCQFKSSVHVSCGNREIGDRLDWYLSSLYDIGLSVILGSHRRT